MKGFLLIIFSTICSCQVITAQTYSIDVQIANQPDEYIRLESVFGDNYSVLDSALAKNGNVHFELSNDAVPGVYRLVLGKTGYARVMNQDPQLLDFIFNKENIQLKTDFKTPLEAVVVFHSEENKLYFDFLARLKEYQNLLNILEQEADSYREKEDSTKAMNAANEFNRLQLEWDLKVVQTVQQNNSLFASKLIEIKRIPIKDAFLTPEERKETYRNEFLHKIDLSDETLINSTAYTDKIFEFLILYNQPGYNEQQRIAAYINAVDKIFSKMGKNEKVDLFLMDYLLHGFDVLGMKGVIDHINNKTK